MILQRSISNFRLNSPQSHYLFKIDKYINSPILHQRKHFLFMTNNASFKFRSIRPYFILRNDLHHFNKYHNGNVFKFNNKYSKFKHCYQNRLFTSIHLRYPYNSFLQRDDTFVSYPFDGDKKMKTVSLSHHNRLYSVMTSQDLDKEIEHLGDLIRSLKAKKAPKEEITSHVEKLKSLKSEREKRAQEALAQGSGEKPFDRATMESLLIKRFFYAPSFSIYGGVAGLYDYGPPGCALQNNILQLWRQHFVLEEDMLELECTNLTPESVLKTSGHVDRFADYMVRDTITGEIFRADHLVKQVLKQRLSDDLALRAGADKKKQKIKGDILTAEVKEDYDTVLETLDNYQGEALAQLMTRLQITAPETGNPVTQPALFNLMFETQIGPTGQFRGFLRPETAQGHFLNFKKLLEFNADQMPFASASIGKSFRNEISPRQGLLRVREFTMAEIEHYVDPLKKDHPRFEEVKDIIIPLYSAERQLAAAGLEEMSIGEAVTKGVINNQTLGYFIARLYLFLIRIGIKRERLRFRQHMSNEMAHYACDCWDAEIENSYGWIECVGCADRSAYDLTAHSKAAKEKLVVRESLPEPISKDVVVLEINKKVFGPAFKKDASHVQGTLESMKISEDEWDGEKVLALDTELKKNGGKTNIVGTDGKTYEITDKMITIEQKTVKIHVREFTPNVIEPSFGIGRILYSLIEHSYYVRDGDEQRAVLSFPAVVAPTKCLIVAISHNEQFLPYLKQCVVGLRKYGISNKLDDSSVSIGKKYARNDELGTPYGITADFQTLKDQTVTLRERDSTKQIREKIPVVLEIMKDLIEERMTWDQVVSQYPVFVQQELEN